MRQAKFIYNIRTMCSDEVIDMGNGIIHAVIKPNILLEHDYKNNDCISVIFNDTKDKYNLKDDSQLEDIYRLYLTKINLTEPLHEYCENNLNKVE